MELKKASLAYWIARFRHTDKEIGQLMSKDERKRIMREARAHAGGVARAASLAAAKANDESGADDINEDIDVEKSSYSVEETSAIVDFVLKNMTPGDAHVETPAWLANKKKKKDGDEPKKKQTGYQKSMTISIAKRDDARQIVYGVVLEPYVVDAQGDWETPESIEETAHNFMKMYREQGVEHVTKSDLIYPVESYIAPTDMVWEDADGNSETVKKGSWVLGSKIEDASIWDAVKNGLLTGFSVEGTGERELDEEPPE